MIEHICIKTLKELEELECENIIINLVAANCYVCMEVNDFLKKYQCEKRIFMLNLSTDDPCELLITTINKFQPKGVPFLVICNKKLKPLKAVTGNDKKQIVDLLNAYNPN